MKRKPTRRDLLAVVSRLQGLFGGALSVHHDRNPNRQAQTDEAIRAGFNLAVDALTQDEPVVMRPGSGGWDDDSRDRDYLRAG